MRKLLAISILCYFLWLMGSGKCTCEVFHQSKESSRPVLLVGRSSRPVRRAIFWQNISKYVCSINPRVKIDKRERIYTICKTWYQNLKFSPPNKVRGEMGRVCGGPCCKGSSHLHRVQLFHIVLQLYKYIYNLFTNFDPAYFLYY